MSYAPQAWERRVKPKPIPDRETGRGRGELHRHDTGKVPVPKIGHQRIPVVFRATNAPVSVATADVP